MSTLQGARVLVTGGAGLVGSTIADQLVGAGVGEIVVLDNFVRGRKENLAWATANGPVTIVEGDIRDRDLVHDVTRGIDVVFHQAAIRITQCAEEPRLALEVLADGTFTVLEAAVAAKVSKVVAASSASVYGLDYVGLRYFNVYGPRMDIHGVYTEVLVRWMDRIAAGQPPLILGDGLQTMDFVYITDIARANLLAAESDATDVVLNVAAGTETSLRELADTMLRVMGSDLEPEFGPARAVNNVNRRLADTEQAAAAIGFRAEVDLEAGLRQLVEWWQAERGGAAS